MMQLLFDIRVSKPPSTFPVKTQNKTALVSLEHWYRYVS